VARQVEIANDLRPQERDHIRADGKLESGKNFFCDSGPAKHLAPFQHQDFFAGAREISGVGEAVVAAANHNNIEFCFRAVRERRHMCAGRNVENR
jgi:hypothetical protein